MSTSVGDLTARLSIEMDESEALQKFRAQIRKLEGVPDPKVGLDTKAADTKMDQLLRRIESFSRASNEIKVSANTTGAEQSVGRLDSVLSRVARAQYTAQVSADVTTALAELRNMQAQLAQLDDRPAHVEVRADTERAIAELQALRQEMGLIDGDAVQVSARMAGMGGVLAEVGSKALALGAGFGVASAAMGIIGKAFDFTKSAIIGTNMEMEETRATLLALTKDAGQTEDILAAMNKEAAKTPFTFGEISAAYVSLLPLTKQYKLDLQELVEVSELLAASNPQEGLEGAAFALREALSGDYTSLIERFNLSRAAINDLKAQGVPALEIVRKSMQGLGIDAELLARRAETTGAKWNTFVDNLRLGLAKAGKPLFDALGSGLDALIGAQDDIADVLNDINEIGTALGNLPPLTVLKVSLEMAGDNRVWELLGYAVSSIPGAKAGKDIYKGTVEASTFVNDFTDERHTQEQFRADYQHSAASPFQQFVDDHAYDETFKDQQALYAEAEKYMLLQEDIKAQQDRIWEAQYRNSQAEREQIQENIRLTNEKNAASQNERDSQEMFALNDATSWYVNTLSTEEQMLFRVTEANSRLVMAQDQVAAAYQAGLAAQSEYTAQGSEYQSQASNIEKAMEVIQRKQEAGIELSEREIYIRDHSAAALERLNAGVDDATVQAGEYAVANGELMTIQDRLNEQYPELTQGSDAYNQKLRDMARAAGISDEAVDGMLGSTGSLTGAIANELVPAIERLIERLEGVQGTYEANVKVTVDASELNAISGQFPGVRLEAFAAGGYIDQPMVSMLGEEAPAHPEWVIPTNPARRGRAMDLWMQAGHSLGVPGFADGGGGRTLAGNTGGVAAGQPVGSYSVDWSWLFAGLDAEAEDYAERAAQKVVQFFGNIDKLVDGSMLRDAQQKLADLFLIRQIMIDSGASDAVIAGLDAQIASAQADVQAIGAVMGSDVIAGMAEEMASKESQEKINASLKQTLEGLTSASDPFQKVQGLGDRVKDLRDAIAVAEAMGNTDLAASLREDLAEAQTEFLNAQNQFTKMLQLGLIDDETIKEMAERGGESFRKVYDQVFGEGALAALQAGWSALSAEQYSQLEAYVAQGGKLTDQMVSSIVQGMQDGAITIDQAMQLLGDQQGRFAKDQQIQLWQSLQSTEDQLMQAIASGDQARIEAAQASYDALMALIIAYAEATGQTVEDVIGKWEAAASAAAKVQIPSVSIPSTSPPRFDSGGSVGGGGISINAALHLPSGKTINEWYAYEIERSAALTPIGVV